MKEYVVFEKMKEDIYTQVETYKKMFPPTVMKNDCRDIIDKALSIYDISNKSNDTLVKMISRYKTVRLVLDDDLNLKEIAS